MEKITANEYSKEIDLKVKFSKALENKYFNKICKSLDLPQEILMKYTSSLMEASFEFEIGAEHLTSWSRDEVLEPILQHRMDEELPTFFTSNYTVDELEKHFVVNDEKMKARRIIERVK